MIGISLLTLVPGLIGGTETAARELVRALARVGELDYRVYTPTIAPDAADGLPSQTVTAYRASRTMPGRMAAMTLASARRRPVLRQLEVDRLDALHFPLNIMLPPVRTPPAVTTVNDVQHLYYPRFFSPSVRAYRKVVYGWTARLSRLVIAPSEYVKATLVERLAVEPERIRVVHHGIDHSRFRPVVRPREPFLLYPAVRLPHKNHERLFEAFALVRRERPELRLVLTGAEHHGKRVPPNVDVRGLVSADELTTLYQTASALVFPSLYEGFGQPPLEAMACGCPVAVSNVASLPEVCGDAARYFDPTAPKEIAEGVLDVLARPEEFSRRGAEQAARFSWEECARRHEELYRELVARS